MSVPLSQALAGILEREEELYRELLDLLAEERGLLISLDAEGLESMASRKRRFAQETAILEEARQKSSTELCSALGLAANTELSRLIPALGDQAERLSQIQLRLRALLHAVKEAQELNANLAGDGLATVRSSLHALINLAPEASVYDSTGTTEASGKVGRLIERSA